MWLDLEEDSEQHIVGRGVPSPNKLLARVARGLPIYLTQARRGSPQIPTQTGDCCLLGIAVLMRSAAERRTFRAGLDDHQRRHQSFAALAKEATKQESLQGETIMFTAHRLFLSLGLVSLAWSASLAQTPAANSQASSPETNIIINRQLVRFVATSAGQEWRLEVVNQTGE